MARKAAINFDLDDDLEALARQQERKEEARRQEQLLILKSTGAAGLPLKVLTGGLMRLVSDLSKHPGLAGSLKALVEPAVKEPRPKKVQAQDPEQIAAE